MPIQSPESLPPLAAQAPKGLVVSGPPMAARDPAPPEPGAGMTEADAVARAVAQANHALGAVSASVQFVVDPDTKVTIVRIVDTAHNEVLRQVPTQEMLDIGRAIDRMQGLLLHTTV